MRRGDAAPDAASTGIAAVVLVHLNRGGWEGRVGAMDLSTLKLSRYIQIDKTGYIHNVIENIQMLLKNFFPRIEKIHHFFSIYFIL